MSSDTTLACMTAVELRSAYEVGSLSPVEVHDAIQEVIESREGVLNALCERDPHASRVAARDSEQRWRAGRPAGPIDGIPITLKENIARSGIPMHSGTAGVEPVIPWWRRRWGGGACAVVMSLAFLKSRYFDVRPRSF